MPIGNDLNQRLKKRNKKILFFKDSIKEDWNLVWADEFNWNGGIDPNKWNFDVGGHGWGIYLNFFTSFYLFRLYA